MGDVAIYQLDRGTSWWCWLCPEHVAAKKRAGFEVKETKPAPHPLTCDECPPERAEP